MAKLLERCALFNHEYGKCTCTTRFEADEGFEFNGIIIVDPFISECGRFFVDPVEYYGSCYTNHMEKINGQQFKLK